MINNPRIASSPSLDVKKRREPGKDPSLQGVRYASENPQLALGLEILRRRYWELLAVCCGHEFEFDAGVLLIVT